MSSKFTILFFFFIHAISAVLSSRYMIQATEAWERDNLSVDTSCKAHGVLDPSDWPPLTSTSDNMELPSARSEEDPYNAHLSACFVPSNATSNNVPQLVE